MSGARTISLTERTTSDKLIVRAADASSFLPDMVVECGGEPDLHAHLSELPIIAVDMLSKITRVHDLRAKCDGSLSVPTHHNCLFVDAEDRRAVMHSRNGEAIATSLPGGGTVTLDPPGCSVNLDTFWEDIPA